jgi:hypothetical protein
VTLNLKLGKGSVTFEYTDDNMTAAWAVKAEDGEEKLLSTMRKVIAFVEAQEGAPALPERIPGMALGMAQTAHPAPAAFPAHIDQRGQGVGNGWAQFAQQQVPELPADRQGDWEMIPPGEQG